MFDMIAVTLASLAAAFVNSIAGGGGLVSLPILFGLFPSAPPATLFGTNKSAMVWGTAWAAGSYARHVRLPWGMLVPAAAAALVGGAVGAWLVTQVSGEWLRRLLPVMLPMAVANVLGSMLGTTLALRHGAPLIRVVFALVVAALIAKTGYDAYLR